MERHGDLLAAAPEDEVLAEMLALQVGGAAEGTGHEGWASFWCSVAAAGAPQASLSRCAKAAARTAGTHTHAAANAAAQQLF